jgi:hypothetical protein
MKYLKTVPKKIDCWLSKETIEVGKKIRRNPRESIGNNGKEKNNN